MADQTIVASEPYPTTGSLLRTRAEISGDVLQFEPCFRVDQRWSGEGWVHEKVATYGDGDGMSFDITLHVNPADPWVQSSEFGAIGRRLYAEKHAVGLLIRPLRVLEIGVRYGYSAACWLAAGARFFHGIDADVPLHGGYPGAPAWALTRLRGAFPQARIEVDIRDTQSMSSLPSDDFDLIHVDGDHTYAGARHDLELAVAAGPRFILVDDLECIPDVADAVRDVIAARKLAAVRFPTVRGDMLIQMRSK